MSKEYECILPLIPTGEKNAISRTALMFKTGLRDRDVRQYIHDARVDGDVFICHSRKKGGYYFPESFDELVAFARTERKRVNALLDVLLPVEKFLKGAGIEW